MFDKNTDAILLTADPVFELLIGLVPDLVDIWRAAVGRGRGGT